MEPREQDMLALQGKRILVAEDNEIFQRAVQQELVAAGATVVLVGNGADAVAQLRDDAPFDLVLMDMDMPVMDGLEATRRIRQEERGRHVLTVAMTSNVSYEDQRRCRDAGMDDFQPKPMPPAAFYSHLANELRAMAIAEPMIAEVMALLGSLRRDVLGR